MIDNGYLGRSSQEPTYQTTFDVPTLCMPDNGHQMDPDHMKSIGYRWTIDSQHPERDSPTRWFWGSPRVWEVCRPKIEAKGFVFTTQVQTL